MRDRPRTAGDSFVISNIKESWTAMWEEEKVRMLKEGCWFNGVCHGGAWSEKLVNLVKRFFLQLAAKSVHRVYYTRDSSGLTYLGLLGTGDHGDQLQLLGPGHGHDHEWVLRTSAGNMLYKREAPERAAVVQTMKRYEALLQRRLPVHCAFPRPSQTPAAGTAV